MNKYFKYLIVVVLLIFPLKVSAYCDSAESVRLKKLANDINIISEPVEKDDKVTFTITITNLREGLKIRDITNRTYYTYKGNSEIVITGFKAGSNNTFKIYGDTSLCNDSVEIKYVNLPYYNKFYDDEVCSDVSEYKLCQKWYRMTLTYTEFKQEVAKYKEKIEQQNNPITNKKSFFDLIINFVINYYYIVLIFIVLICLLAFYINTKRNRLY